MVRLIDLAYGAARATVCSRFSPAEKLLSACACSAHSYPSSKHAACVKSETCEKVANPVFGEDSPHDRSFHHLLGWLCGALGSRQDLVLENLALRQQLLASHTKRPRRRLSSTQQLFWVFLRKIWSGWQKPSILITPRTVMEWHRAGFRLYWRWLSHTRHFGGRQPVSKEIRTLR